ncbi:pimeloyl-ACP methyl ester carboxylesterase [Actinoalloteichus hoggarensis]|uniref:2-hydroxy-6-oxononadienedioate/2-hydroxy-6-oxononatrienedioate hydrolase n=1 Tax=Actinoalloteichus hoggarensis TaxID=1470176 RepID=A0A221W7T1_9PSEU|nr:alpha/beta hydrolase [Actinoalloteichus hoggarensis]ASO22022.1 2-hydroxy-6-oxononadienedioate/2-hydroxy-6-oxononatrienedioate hydrolase [Actinoalloteichus hoggarensis]MBB5923897.1 pimeloyl-ACP methyl ester carboxylesterase [Actinoalloteichus hoggarensis]
MNDKREPYDSTYVPFPEGRLRVITAGDHGPPVLLLSGAGMDNAMLSWRHLIPALAAEHRVLALDWPKQGGSRQWEGVADHQTMLRCITGVLDHFGLESVNLVGMSQGGGMTLAYAIEHPDRVRNIVPIAPGGIISFPPGVHQLLWLIAKMPRLTTGVSTMMFRKREAVVSLIRKTLVPGPVDDFEEIVDEVHQLVHEGGAGASDWQNGSIGFWRMRLDLRPRLAEISCPTLFIQGDKDVGVAPKHTVAAAAEVPGARLEMFEGNGHWVNRQSPERVNALIIDFLAADRAGFDKAAG